MAIPHSTDLIVIQCDYFLTLEMKILFVGASGIIGGGVLEQCLAHPNITTIVAFVRRELPAAISSNSKLKCVIKKDFAEWQDDELRAHADAAAMVWYVRVNGRKHLAVSSPWFRDLY